MHKIIYSEILFFSIFISDCKFSESLFSSIFVSKWIISKNFSTPPSISCACSDPENSYYLGCSIDHEHSARCRYGIYFFQHVIASKIPVNTQFCQNLRNLLKLCPKYRHTFCDLDTQKNSYMKNFNSNTIGSLII